MRKKVWKALNVLTGVMLLIPIFAGYASSASPTPQRGGILKAAGGGEPPMLNTMVDYSVRVVTKGAWVFNGLVMIDPTQEEISVEKVVSSLAEKWEISSDQKVYTFHLRRGVKFHDGQPFTAKDAKYSLDFLADPKRSAMAPLVEMMERVEVVDNHTVKVHLKYPHVPFLLYLCYPYCIMLPAHLSGVSPKSPDFLVGTGPFKFKKRIPGKVWIYERNPDYFIKGLPYLDGVESYIMTTPTAVDAFIGGRLDMAVDLRYDLGDKALIDKIRKNVPEAIIKLKPINVLRGVIFNVAGLKGRKGPWQDVRVRRAMAMVTDFPGTIMAGQGSIELGVSSGIVAPYVPTGLPWKEAEKILGIDKPMDVRVKEAKRLMKEAGYPDGFKGEVISRETGHYWKSAEYMTEGWRKSLNIQLNFRILEPAIIFPRRDAGDFDLCLDPALGTFGGSPEETLNRFLSTTISNHGQWSNAEYDRLYSQLIRETDSGRRAEVSAKMQRIFLEEVPFLIYASPVVGTAHRPTLHGHVIQTGHTGWACMDRMWLEK